MKLKITVSNQRMLSLNHKRMILFAILFLSLGFVGCNDKIPDLPKPKNLVEREKMVTILTDLVKVESAVKMQFEDFTDFSELVAKAGDSILVKNKVSPKDFDQSMDYYGSRQEDMISIYDAVNANLKKEIEQLRTK